jgi:hypothetical protein
LAARSAATNIAVGLSYCGIGEYRLAVECHQTIIGKLTRENLRWRFGWAGVPAVLSRAYSRRDALAELGEFAEGIGHGEDAIRIAESGEHPFSLARPRSVLAGGICAAYRGAVARAGELGLRRCGRRRGSDRAGLLRDGGRPVDARAELGRAAEMFRAMQMPQWLAGAESLRCWLLPA